MRIRWMHIIIIYFLSTSFYFFLPLGVGGIDEENIILSKAAALGEREATRRYPKSEKVEEMQYEIVMSFYSPLNFVVTNEVEKRKVDPNEAIKEARIYLKEYPNGKHAAMVQHFIAFIYQYHKKDYTQAIKEFDKLIQNYPEDETLVAMAHSEKARLQNEIRQVESEKFKLNIKSSKKEYELGKPFDIELTVINNSNAEINILPGYSQGSWAVELNVYDEERNWVYSSPSGYEPLFKKDDFITLAPGAFIKTNYEVEEYTPPPQLKKDLASDENLRIFPIGKYTIQAEYIEISDEEKKSLRVLTGKNFLNGKWISNTIEVTVMPTKRDRF